jgi:hypothetical protein
MTELIPNPRGDTPPPAPTRPDGTPYRFEMIFDGGGWRAYADEPAELLDALIPGYAAMHSPVARAEARIAHATGVQVALQASLNAGQGLDDCTDEERRLLLGPRHEPPAPLVWRAPVPLVLVATFYRPQGALHAPRAEPPGQLWWIDPGDDITLLTSLHRTGLITLATAADPPADDGKAG